MHSTRTVGFKVQNGSFALQCTVLQYFVSGVINLDFSDKADSIDDITESFRESSPKMRLYDEPGTLLMSYLIYSRHLW